MTEPAPDPPADLLARARDGERRACGRLLSVVERGGAPADALAALVHPLGGRAHVVGITGAPGAGKSTLTGALAAAYARRGRQVAVLAVDPSSPVTGGAILGDRIRMDDALTAARERVFVRSMATRGRRGGLALAVPGAVAVLDAAGFDVIVVETAGVGQIEVDIVAEADTTVVVLNPGWGDAIQASKAGVMELADVFVVNKADRPGTDDAVRDIEHVLDLGHPHDAREACSWRPPVLRVIATEGNGIDALVAALGAHQAELERTGVLASRRTARIDSEVRRRVQGELARRLDEVLVAEHALIEDVRARALSPAEAAQRLAAHILGPGGGN